MACAGFEMQNLQNPFLHGGATSHKQERDDDIAYAFPSCRIDVCLVWIFLLSSIFLFNSVLQIIAVGKGK